MFGLKEGDIKYIINTVKQFDEIEAVGIFGSRAKESYRQQSDIDIMLYGNDINIGVLFQVKTLLDDESPYPYYVDVKHYESLSESIFKAEVDNSVQLIYRK